VICVQGSQGYGSTESDFVDIESFPSVPDTSLPELNLQVPVRLLQRIIVIFQRGANLRKIFHHILLLLNAWIRIEFNVIPDLAFTSMQVRNGAKPMLIRI
jgi:hypothetical protein